LVLFWNSIQLHLQETFLGTNTSQVSSVCECGALGKHVVLCCSFNVFFCLEYFQTSKPLSDSSSSTWATALPGRTASSFACASTAEEEHSEQDAAARSWQEHLQSHPILELVESQGTGQ
jgi:hypothetical protein